MANIPDDRDSKRFSSSNEDKRPDERPGTEEQDTRGSRNAFQDHELIPDATAEIKAMAADGMEHPSTKPVLTGAAVGAVAGWILPVVGPIVGGVAGAGFMLYKRLRP